MATGAEIKAEITRPKAPETPIKTRSNYSPAELDPDLGMVEIGREIVRRLDTPSIISKKFAVRYGLFKALNHVPKVTAQRPDGTIVVIDPGNETGYDSRSRTSIYDHVAAKSVNIDGSYFFKLWDWMMKPKVIMQGGMMVGPGGVTAFEEDKPGIISRLIGFIFGTSGGKKNGPS